MAAENPNLTTNVTDSGETRHWGGVVLPNLPPPDVYLGIGEPVRLMTVPEIITLEEDIVRMAMRRVAAAQDSAGILIS